MKQQNEKKAKKSRMNKEKRFYLFTALGCAAALMAIIVVAVAMSGVEKPNEQAGNNSSNSSPLPDNSGNNTPGGEQGDNGEGDGEQVVVTPEGMVMPVKTVSVLNDYGFYHNKTLNCYYEHTGVDFSAQTGAEVVAVDEGVVESVYKDDLLSGTEIVIAHADGVKSVYRFVTEVEGLKAGDSVRKGQTIATVAEATGDEYKDGAHLHFEILKNNVSIDPAVYLTLEEK